MGKAQRPFRVSWLDRLVMGLAPTWGLQRLRSRAAATTLTRHYEAASTKRRADDWYRSAGDANLALGRSLTSLRELSRDLRRNNGWARRGLQVIANNTVGWGIQAKPVAQSPEIAARAAELWKAWSSTAACDFDGRVPFSGLQRLVMSTVAEAGEALVMVEPAAVSDGLAIPVRVRVLEPDYLDHTKDGIEGASGPIIQGVEFDQAGRRVAYWIFNRHPGSARPGAAIASRRVPADQVLHVYRVDRAGQVRGEAWLAAAITKLNDFDDYEDAVLMQQKIAACFGAFVKNLDGTSPIGEQSADDETLETLEPGHVAYLAPGEDVSFATPPPTSDHGSFSTATLRRIAASMGVTYEDLTGDYSQVNFSSARMGRIAHWSNVHDWRWNMLIPQFCDAVWQRVMVVAASLYGWSEVPRAHWSPPPLPMLDPDKEASAYVRLVRSGAMTLFEMIRELGYDPESHLAEIAAGNAKLDELKIWLDSDPRRTSAAGLTQERPGAGTGGKRPSDASSE